MPRMRHAGEHVESGRAASARKDASSGKDRTRQGVELRDHSCQMRAHRGILCGRQMCGHISRHGRQTGARQTSVNTVIRRSGSRHTLRCRQCQRPIAFDGQDLLVRLGLVQ